MIHGDGQFFNYKFLDLRLKYLMLINYCLDAIKLAVYNMCLFSKKFNGNKFKSFLDICQLQCK